MTVSGFSAGGHYSVTLNIIWSSIFKGAGNSKGGAFDTDRFTDMTTREIRDAAIETIDALAARSHIDPTSNLAENAAILIAA